MKQYLKRLLDAKKTTVIELNRYRYVEIAHERPTPIFLSEEMWLNYVEPFKKDKGMQDCLLYTSPSPRDRTRSRMPSSA